MGIRGNSSLNDSNYHEGNHTNSFAQPGWQISLWAITYSFIVFGSVIGNLTVIWIILAHKRLRTVTNYLIVNLAVSDVFLATFNTIFNFIYASHNVWYFDKGFCRFQNLFPITAIFVSVYTMTALAADRYMAIIHPFRPRLSARTTKVVIGVIWLAAFGLAFPQCFYADIMTDNGRTICLVDWPEYNGTMHHLEYHVAVIVLIYMLPLTFMFVAYTIIGVTLWGSGVPGDQINIRYYQHRIQAKKKFVKTMILVVLTFAICWLPFHMYFLLGSFVEDIYEQKYIQQVYLAIFLLAMSSTVFNPLIYCCRNQTFRSGFRLAFRWCPCINATEIDKFKLSRPGTALQMLSMGPVNKHPPVTGKQSNNTEESSLKLINPV